MLGTLNRFIISCSQSWWKFLLIFLGQTGSLQLLTRITNQFPAVAAGSEPFDMQNELTDGQIFTQLEGYTDAAFDLYTQFQLIDYFFPLFAGLLLATVCAFSLRIAAPGAYRTAEQNNLFLLLLVPTLFDWLENISLLRVVTAWPEQAQVAANVAVWAKMGKLSTMSVAFAVTGALLLAAATIWVRNRWRSRPGGAAGTDSDPID
ncbi:MAG: hypothetical protein JJ992_18095 [Planctomycetes bacterium]|nr:hypothetical protein [Planctomycetota bacterium]